jgi:NAD(P)H-flavin reductase
MIINGLCADYGSRFCPCVLAVTGGCVVCSQVNGKAFCDCKASGGNCIKEELLRNGGKPKPGRLTYECKVMSVIHHEGLVFFRVTVPLSLEREVKRPGGFVFIRRKDTVSWYDVPISVQYEEMMVGSIGMTVLFSGVKTLQFKDLAEGDTLLIRGPFTNGLLGLHHLEMQQSGRCLILTKGIGLLPSVSAVRYLQLRHNETDLYVDEGGFSPTILKLNLDLYELPYQHLTLLDADGDLATDVKHLIRRFVADGGNLIHVGASEFVIHEVAAYLAYIGVDHVKLSACNNARMCCGEGVCGACTETTADRRVIHHCKEQVNAKKI